MNEVGFYGISKRGITILLLVNAVANTHESLLGTKFTSRDYESKVSMTFAITVGGLKCYH